MTSVGVYFSVCVSHSSPLCASDYSNMYYMSYVMIQYQVLQCSVPQKMLPHNTTPLTVHVHQQHWTWTQPLGLEQKETHPKRMLPVGVSTLLEEVFHTTQAINITTSSPQVQTLCEQSTQSNTTDNIIICITISPYSIITTVLQYTSMQCYQQTHDYLCWKVHIVTT